MTKALAKSQSPEMLSVLFTCSSTKIQSLLENTYGFIGVFIENVNKEFFNQYTTASEKHQQSLKTLTETISFGLNATPRIKKLSNENAKLIHSKFEDNSSFQAYIEFTLAISQNKEEEKDDSNLPEAQQKKVKQIMDIFCHSKTKVAPKKDFRSFLKQQKNVGAKVQKSEDIIVVQDDYMKDEQ